MEPMGRLPIFLNKTDRLERQSLAWSTIGLGMLFLIGLISAWTLREVNASDLLVDETYNVIDTSQQLLSDLHDAETAELRYLLSGDESYVASYRSAISRIPQGLATLRTLTSDNPSQQRRITDLQPLLMTRISTLAETIRLRKGSGFEAAEQSRLTDERRHTIEQIGRIGDDIQGEEYRLLQQRTATRRARLQAGLAATLGSATLALIALILAPMQVRRAVKERDFAHRQKQESESMAQSLFEAAPQAIIIVDQKGEIVMANPETERIFGYKADELRGKSVEILVPEHLRALHPAHRGQYHARPATRTMGLDLQLKALRKGGGEFDTEISLTSIETAKGTLAVAFASDISRRRADEKAIRQQREELRQLAGKLMSAQDDERRRIARDLHDDLSQDLACIAMDLGRLALTGSRDEIAPRLRPIQRRAAEAAELVRRISHQLHPSILDDLGLRAALEEFCIEFEHRSGVITHFASQNVPDSLPPDVSSCVYHVAGECLRNVSKHSQSESVFVDIEFSGSSLHLSVRDEGKGFQAQPAHPRSGIGIVAMKERVRLLGGSLVIESGPEKGTRVEVRVPVTISVDAV
ncbi:MAG TPA: CHASE3 domain-containing protein [Acidobacteriaceae bacterium]|nr:CHASE3 domain-containing protein [Acidobacteriaceae bacterium]